MRTRTNVVWPRRSENVVSTMRTAGGGCDATHTAASVPARIADATWRPSGTSVHRAGSRTARIAAHTAGASGRVERLRARTSGIHGEHRKQLLQIGAATGGAGRRFAAACEVFEVMTAAAALVFEKRHVYSLPRNMLRRPSARVGLRIALLAVAFRIASAILAFLINLTFPSTQPAPVTMFGTPSAFWIRSRDLTPGGITRSRDPDTCSCRAGHPPAWGRRAESRTSLYIHC